MSKKVMRQKYFVSRELRTSIALIILWALLVTAFFTYFTKQLGEKIGHGTLLFFIVMIGYVVIVVVLTMLFSHRLLGPFQRLKSEIRLIIAGDYYRRLTVRKNDDVYIRSFIDEVNRILNELEKLHSYKEDIEKHIDAELLNFISLIEEGDHSREKLREAVLSFHKKVKSLEHATPHS
jgi:signal transduction histidine kinase